MFTIGKSVTKPLTLLESEDFGMSIDSFGNNFEKTIQNSNSLVGTAIRHASVNERQLSLDLSNASVNERQLSLDLFDESWNSYMPPTQEMEEEEDWVQAICNEI